jgi:hypothetical protein
LSQQQRLSADQYTQALQASKAIPKWERAANEWGKLVIDRWVGLEGVLTVISQGDGSLSLLKTAATEDPNRGVNAFYQKIAQSKYPQLEGFTFMTIPGPIAVLLYGGSLWLLAGGMAVLFFVGLAIERFTFRLLNNHMSAAAVGTGVAYLTVQLNFPKVLLIFYIEVVLFVVGVLFFQWCISALGKTRAHTAGL